MFHRRSRLVSPCAALLCILLAGCASVGSQPPYVKEDPKAKSQDACQAQKQSPQGQSTTDCDKKAAPN